ncbi:protein OXIDATIVE STRESS 3-like [Arachis stenosperma]|uniref:protein OXIDATIVE STRESS 3-like n=1 Tax=Arachis stenosperma TaxID=217475 RepID=UPI0025AD35F8|nr:protein OXIDATIVE STRESS 3-like [Arachis stenosperma]
MIMDGNNNNWVVKDGDHDDDICDASISTGSISSEDSMNSACSSSSSDDELAEDASSSSSSSNSNGPLYKLSELMNHLPIKRGLSMFYQGKAESFTCLERVQSIENLAKKENGSSGYRNRKRIMKWRGLDTSNRRMMRISSSYTSPKAKISKKPPSRGSSFASLVTNKQRLSISSSSSLLGASTRSYVHNNF